MLGSAPLPSSSRRISSWWGLPWRPAAMCKAVWPWAYQKKGKWYIIIQTIFVHTHKHTNTCKWYRIQFWVSCYHETHFHVDKVFLQGIPEQITDQINVPLLHSQVQQCLVTFDFLEFENWKWEKKHNETTSQTETNKKEKTKERVGWGNSHSMTSSWLD